MLNLFETEDGRKAACYSFTNDSFEPYMRNLFPMENISPKMRAWRFWASFLGLGIVCEYIRDKNTINTFLPNMYVNLKDAKRNSAIPAGTYTISEFMKYTTPYCSEAFPENGIKKLNLGLANGLRELQDRKDAIVTCENDAKETWIINSNPTHQITDAVTHITIK